MHCRMAWGQWAVQLVHYTAPLLGGQRAVDLLQCTTPLPGGSGRCNFCNTPPHCLGAVGGEAPAMDCLNGWGAVGSGTPAIHGPAAWGGSGQCNSCNALPHCLGAVGSGTLATPPHNLGGSGHWNSCNALPQCLGAVGSGAPTTYRLTAWGHGAVELLQCTASLLGGQWAVELPQRTASLPGGGGRCHSSNTPPHCLWAMGSGTRAMHCLTAQGAVGSGTPATQFLTAWGQWATQLLQCTAAPPGGKRQCNSCEMLPHCLGDSGWLNCCNARPHCLEAVGDETPAIQCLTAWGGSG